MDLNKGFTSLEFSNKLDDLYRAQMSLSKLYLQLFGLAAVLLFHVRYCEFIG